MNAVNPKDILVITTSSVDGLKIKKYLRPVSAHIVAGTNLFSDFFAGWTDVFGGRSGTYKKQLSSLYNEAIAEIRNAAYEIGANCVMGLSIVMDEISGKGKTMFMLTAVGTAVVLEREVSDKNLLIKADEKFENVAVDRVNVLRSKKTIIANANNGSLKLNDEVWDFITSNQVDEIFPYLLKEFDKAFVNDSTTAGSSAHFYNKLSEYIDALPENTKTELLYRHLQTEEYEKICQKLLGIIKDLHLFDAAKTMELLKNDNFQIQKRGLATATYDKPFNNKQDIDHLKTILNYIQEIFPERGKKSMKKHLLSSKEKEVWTCECGRTNDVGSYCSACEKDIYGFKENELKPKAVGVYIEQKIELINEFV